MKQPSFSSTFNSVHAQGHPSTQILAHLNKRLRRFQRTEPGSASLGMWVGKISTEEAQSAVAVIVERGSASPGASYRATRRRQNSPIGPSTMVADLTAILPRRAISW